MDEHECPVCREPLATMDLGGLSADYCSAHGIWLGEAEYQVLMRRAGSDSRKDLQSRVRAARAEGYEAGRASSYARRRRARLRRKREHESIESPPPAPPRNVETEKPCPVCGDTMRPETWRDFFETTSEVTVERCPAHGIWFDTGELDVLVARAERDAARESEGKVRKAWAEGHRKGRASVDE